jgi:hypothetical protein
MQDCEAGGSLRNSRSLALQLKLLVRHHAGHHDHVFRKQDVFIKYRRLTAGPIESIQNWSVVILIDAMAEPFASVSGRLGNPLAGSCRVQERGDERGGNAEISGQRVEMSDAKARLATHLSS